MKKTFLFMAALALVFVSCEKKSEVEDKTIATFEEAAVSPTKPESVLTFTTDTTVFLQSGNFQIQQTVSYGGTYVSGAVISNRTDTTFESYLNPYKSIAGGAYEGKNYIVWYEDGFTPNVIKLTTAATVPGMYVCNNVYAYGSMKNGDSYAGNPFGSEDWLLLTINGFLEGKAVDSSVKFYLAKGTDIITEWTYVDLTQLGKVDQLSFTMTGSRTGDYGLNTPSYFCIDNLGAKK